MPKTPYLTICDFGQPGKRWSVLSTHVSAETAIRQFPRIARIYYKLHGWGLRCIYNPLANEAITMQDDVYQESLPALFAKLDAAPILRDDRDCPLKADR